MPNSGPEDFSPVRACDNVLRLLAELDLVALQRAASGVMGPEQFESCLLGHSRMRERYLQLRRLALQWEADRYGLLRHEVLPGLNDFPGTPVPRDPRTMGMEEL